MEPFRRLEAVAAPLPQPNIDTDRIIPARFLGRLRGVDHAPFLFHDARRLPGSDAEDPAFPLNRPEWRAARIVVAGRNFACGSSREAAVWALHDHGVRCAVAPSFGDIFRNNAVKNGLLPVALPAEAVSGLLAQLGARPGAAVAVDLPAQIVAFPDGATHLFDVDPFDQRCLLEGQDELAYTLSLADETAA